MTNVMKYLQELISSSNSLHIHIKWNIDSYMPLQMATAI